MNTADALLVSTILADLLTKAQQLAALQQEAARQGRTISATELDKLGLADDAARARQQLQLDAMKEGGTPG